MVEGVAGSAYRVISRMPINGMNDRKAIVENQMAAQKHERHAGKSPTWRHANWNRSYLINIIFFVPTNLSLGIVLSSGI